MCIQASASVDEELQPLPKAIVECGLFASFENHIQVRMDAELFFFLHELVQNYMHECEKVTGVVAGGGGGGGGKSVATGDGGSKTGKEDKKKESKKGDGKEDDKMKGDAVEKDSNGGLKTAENGESQKSGDAATASKPDGAEGASTSVSSTNAAASSSSSSSAPEDWREFVCKRWHLKPTMSFLTAGVFSEPIEPSVGVDYVLDKLGFKHAKTTIPKWTQRGVMDPMDKLLAVMMTKFIQSLGEKDWTDRVHPVTWTDFRHRCSIIAGCFRLNTHMTQRVLLNLIEFIYFRMMRNGFVLVLYLFFCKNAFDENLLVEIT